MPVDPVATRRFVESLSTHLEDHLAQWKSSLADARREIDTLLTGAGEKIPAQAKPLFPEDLMAMLLEDVMPPPPPPQKVVERVVEKVIEQVMVPGPAGAADWSTVRGALAAIESAKTQVDVLTRFLTQAHSHASRVALLVLRNERLSGWKGIGYDASGGRDEAIKAIDLPTGEDPFAAEVLKRERSMLAEPPDESSPLRRALSGKAPVKTVLVPMMIRDRLAGLLCADELPGDEGRLNESALEVLTFVTGLAVDLLAARKKIPSPSLTPTGETLARYEPPKPAEDIGATVRAIPAVKVEPPAPAPKPAPRPAPPPSAVRPATPPPPAPPSFAPEPPPSVKHRITDASDALRALEESAAAKRKDHLSLSADFSAPRPSTPSTPAVPALTTRITPDDLGLTTAVPSAKVPVSRPPTALPPVPAPPRPAPPTPPIAPTGDLTMAFEQLKTVLPPPAPRPAPPAPAMPPPAAPEPPKAAVPAPAAAAPPAGSVGESLLGGSSAPMAPPAGFVPRFKRGGDEQSRAHEDAKRLARLLVSEIKLYNERKVDEGRSHNDLFERLKDDIQRSRQVFEERTPEAVRQGTDYFRDELVRILADGRAEALGPM